MTLSVLVVEDSPTQRHTLCRAFTAAGHRVSEARNGAEALLTLGAPDRPDVVVSDCEMPFLDGYQLCRLIKDDRALRHLPVLLLTAEGAPLSGFWARTCGADRFLRKDADPLPVVRAAEALAAHHGGSTRPPPGPPLELRLEDVLRRLARAVESQLLESTLRGAVAALYDGRHEPERLANEFMDIVRDLIVPGALLLTLPSETGTIARGLAGPAAGPQVRDALVAQLVAGGHLAADGDVRWRIAEGGPAGATPTQGLITVGDPGAAPSGAVAVALSIEAAQRYDAILGVALDELGRVLHLERAHLDLLRLATLDGLTGLLNRRALLELLDREVHRAARYGHPLAVISLDIDHFKQVNDRHGHPAGDEVIREVAARIARRVRVVDAVGRLGGEEFLVVCPDTSGENACHLAEDLRRLIAARPMAGLHVTVSLGVAGFDAGADTRDSLLARADARLYAAKHAGRDRVAA
jgi:two-component system cell cycle response regulator